MKAHDIIVRPLVTEASMKDVANGKYVFVVEKSATKDDIKRAMFNAFGVHIVSVATSIVKGKSKRAGKRRLEIAQQVYKKATVKVRTGEKIALFEPATEEKKK